MRRVIAVVMAVMLCAPAWGMDFPAIGTCNGDNIRLREFPGPKGRIAGHVHTGMDVVVLGETTAGGQQWYKVDHPARKGNVWVPAQYIIFTSAGTEEVFVHIRLMLGINMEKTRALLGSPLKWGLDFIEYPGMTLKYDAGGLQKAEVSVGGYAFGGVEVGDSPDKLVALGMPKGWNNSRKDWTLKGSTGEEITFTFGDNVIASMVWERPEKVRSK